MGRGTEQVERNIGRRVVVAGAGGLVIAAIVLAMYALVNRRPDRRIGGGFEDATQYLAISLGLGIAVAVVMVGLATALLSGRAVGGWCSWLLAGVAGATMWVYLSGTADSAREVLAGPDPHPMIELTQFTWILYALACLLLMVAVVVETPGSGRWWLVLPAIVGGLVFALAAGNGIVAGVSAQKVKAAAAEQIPIPDLPTQVGEHVAYSLVSTPEHPAVPAGPGFVMAMGSDLVGFDGSTGSARWRFPEALMPRGCSLEDLISTGNHVGSVVVMRCYGALVGIDAMTGKVLWTNHSEWSLAGPLLAPDGAVAVAYMNDDAYSIGSLDPRSGKILWSRGVECAPDELAATAVAIVFADECGSNVGDLVRIFDSRSGAEHRFVLPLSEGLAGARGLRVHIAAVQEDSVLLSVASRDDVPETLVLVDTAGGVSRELAGEVTLAVNVDSRHYPGALIEVTSEVTPNSVDVVVMPGGERRHVAGPSMYLWASEFETGVRWAQVGDDMVTAATFVDNDFAITIVDRHGTVSTRPSPCGGDDLGGVTVVPGALLVSCVRGEIDQLETVDILALQ